MNASFISVDGVRLHLARQGKGTPLVLIHGLGGALMWQKVMEPFSRRFDVLIPALPGFGESEGTPRTYTTAEHAGAIQQVLLKSGIEKAIIVGISYGGQVSAEFAARHPAMTERLILTCSSGLLKTPRVVSNPLYRKVFALVAKHILLKNKKRMCKKGERSFYDLANRPPDLCDNFFRYLMQPYHREAWLNAAKNSVTGGEQFRSVLTRISAPTLILWGEEDKTIPVSQASEFQKMIKSSRLVTFKQCAHSIPLEKPLEFCREVEGLVDSN